MMTGARCGCIVCVERPRRNKVSSVAVCQTRAPKRYASLSCAIAFSAIAWTAVAQAAPASLSVKTERDLEFGTFAVATAGWRSVSPAGEVRDNGILAFPGSAIGPARYSIIFDRGNESKRSLDVLVQVMIIAPRSFAERGVSASLSNLASDLPVTGSTPAGLSTTARISNCRERLCTLSFNVGGRIDVSRTQGGATLRIPIAVTATILSVN